MKAIQNEDGKSIKNFSMVLTIVSALMIFGNLGAFAVTSFLPFDMSPGESYEYKNFGDQVFAWITGHFNMLFAGLALFGLFLLVLSVFLKRLKLWASISISIMAILFLSALWVFFTSMILSIIGQNGFTIFILIPIVIAVIGSSPALFILHYLNSKRIRILFQ